MPERQCPAGVKGQSPLAGLKAASPIWSRVKRLAQVWIDAPRQPVLGISCR